MVMSIKRCVHTFSFIQSLTFEGQAYLEFFVSPSQLTALLPLIEKDPNFVYYAIKKNGDLRTNAQVEGPNAVTWGVFPGKEIVQPTIVEAISFMAWKVSALPLLCEISIVI